MCLKFLHECSVCRTSTQTRHQVGWRKLCGHSQSEINVHTGGIWRLPVPQIYFCLLKEEKEIWILIKRDELKSVGKLSLQKYIDCSRYLNSIVLSFKEVKKNCVHNIVQVSYFLCSQKALYHWVQVAIQACQIERLASSQIQQFHYEVHYH